LPPHLLAPPQAAPRAPRPPSFTTRLAGGLLGTALGAGALGVLILALVAFRPPNGQGSAPTSTVSSLVVACGVAPTAVRPTAAPSNPTDAGRTATIGLQATATAAAQPSPTPVVPIPHVDPCTVPGTSLLTLDQAAALVRALLDDPTATLYARYGTVAGTNAPSIVVERPFPAESSLIFDRDHFEIDAATGALIGASWVSNESASIPNQPIDEGQAITRAETFARAQDPSFDRLERRRVRSSPNTTFPNTEIVWQLRAEDAGAWLPTTLTVSISLRTGLPISYRWWQQDYAGLTAPLIDANEASARVLAIAQQEPRYAGATVAETTLWVAAPKQLNNENDDFRLVWTIGLANVPQTGGENLTQVWYVDALTGEVIRSKGSG